MWIGKEQPNNADKDMWTILSLKMKVLMQMNGQDRNKKYYVTSFYCMDRNGWK